MERWTCFIWCHDCLKIDWYPLKVEDMKRGDEVRLERATPSHPHPLNMQAHPNQPQGADFLFGSKSGHSDPKVIP